MIKTAPADTLRGHDFLPDEEALAAIPPLYATEDVSFYDKVLHLHFFVAASDWYVAELDADRRIAFGYVNLGDPANAEWGYVDLDELRSVLVRHPAGLLLVERDLAWTAQPFRFLG